jgi:hypothetical protein
MLPKIAYSVLGLPVHYHNVNYEDTKLIASKMSSTRDKISRAPNSGILLVTGTAAPIVNQFLDERKRKVVGFSFVDYYNSKLSNEETMSVPNGQVIVIYGIGTEPASNPQFASKLLNALLGGFKNSLVILETDKSVSNFQTSYGILITNSISIPEIEAAKWI